MDDNSKKTIIMTGVFGFLSAVIMLLRIAMRKARGQVFNLSDYLTMAAMVCLATRTAFATVVTLWSNNNLSPGYRTSHKFSDTEIYHRVVGSQLTLVNRIVYNTYIWIQKAVVLLLYRRMLDRLPGPLRIIRLYWGFLITTYLAVQSVTFVECRPFSLYWQVMPNPGSCTRAPVQLIVFVALNITTDVALIILPMPWLIGIKQSLKRRLSLIGLFSIGFLLIAIAIARLPIYGNGTSQVNRNTWGSIEEFAAAFVANVPTLFALRRRHPTFDNTTFQTIHHASRAGFTEVLEEGITVTRCVEFRRDTINDLKEAEKFESICIENSSQNNLVRVTVPVSKKL
ncbi:hypothetical protein BKA61DRAFT_564320 [Leptodontidium sp. MPI-SDFR-AT-0119]|nr:hypothetical protein BKA61DRAFT_564320 [Leptodontidium sp. MPI-SDFR-AT-0119]